MSDDNNLTNIRNVLGFLLAGFGAVLSFLGVRSSEVTTILRNDAGQASVIALILLVGVLTAIWTIITSSKKKIYPLSAAAIVILLLGIGALSGIPEVLLVTRRQPGTGPGRGGGQHLIG